MKYFDFSQSGVFSLITKDLKFVQDGLNESISTFLNSISNGRRPAIVSGCVATLTGSTLQVSAGVALIDGQFVRVQELTSLNITPSGSKGLWLKLSDIACPTYSSIDFDGGASTKFLNREIVGTIVFDEFYEDASQVITDWRTLPTLKQSIDFAVNGSWSILSPGTGFSVNVVSGYPVNMQSRVSASGEVQLSGAVSRNVGNTSNTTLATLPANMRPSKAVKLSCIGTVNGTPNIDYNFGIIVETSGAIKYQQLGGITDRPDLLFLDGLSFKI